MRALTQVALSISALALPLLVPSLARAQAAETPRAPERVESRISAEAFGGSGINSRFGAAYGARVGYTTPQRVYLGADATRYQGQAGSSETLLGGDIGMRFFPTNRLEVRPFALVGAAIEAPGEAGGSANTQFALQPGLLAAYHLGAAYLGAEGRIQVAPTPAAASLMGTAGLTF